ncbi:MAG: HIT domain-containing protein, partial [Bacillota bacterium]|nr:HIT domain-containing protein [Bacillota bacterium]
ASLAAVEEADQNLLGKLQLVISQIAENEGIADDGYRVTTNIGENGGQTVKHLHYHIIGGRKLNVHVD